MATFRIFEVIFHKFDVHEICTGGYRTWKLINK